RVTFVRSPIAHAMITGIDVSAAREAEGVVAVLTVRDMDDLPPPPPPDDNDESGGGGAPPPPPGPPAAAPPARGPARGGGGAGAGWGGGPVGVVITDDRYQGEDAAELVSVDYEPLPTVVGVDAALASETPLFAGTESCVAVTIGEADGGAGFDGCDVVVEQTIMNQRLAPGPLEGRAVAVSWADGKLTVWVSTQNAQIARFILAGALGLDPGMIRVVAPDVGGGFGAKIGVDRDALIVAWAAKHTGQSLRWAETRSENMIAMTHGRAQRHKIKIGGTPDGRVLADRLGIV